MSAQENDRDSLLDIFIFETLQNIEQLEKLLLDSEKGQEFSSDEINEIFRIMHTIKGSSAMMSYSGITALAHKAEDLFYYIRDSKPEKYDTGYISDIMLRCIDYIRDEIQNIRDGKGSDNELPEMLLYDINTCLSGMKTSLSTESAVDFVIHSVNSFKAVFYFEEGCEMENIRAYSITKDMSEYVYNLSFSPDNLMDDDSTADIIKQNGFTVLFESDMTYSELTARFSNIPFIKDTYLTLSDLEKCSEPEFEEITEDSAKPVITETDAAQKKNIVSPDSHQSAQSLLSINISKLDKLMNLIGEVVISESMVVGNNDLKGLELPSFQKEAAHLHKIVGEMQDLIMSMRLVPLTTTFQKTHRIVRDMAKKLDKEVNLKFIGEETEVDKKIAEQLSDPLMHLVRNSIDHGLEAEEERIALGKPAAGTITLEAYNAGSSVYVLVKDDGRGLDKEKILSKAKKNNILFKPESDMTEKDIFNLIFLPGFSTNEQVSEYSGRGVGMDVVMQNITSVCGSVSVESTNGGGTAVIMKIPLTVAIIDGMNLKIGEKRFTIPITAIRESFKPDKDSIFTDTDGNEMIIVRNECYAIMKLHKQWNIKTEVTELEKGILIMVEHEEGKRCIFADGLIGQQQVVVKTLPDYIKKTASVEGLSGCTLLGDGSISLILDPAWLTGAQIDYKNEE